MARHELLVSFRSITGKDCNRVVEMNNHYRGNTQRKSKGKQTCSVNLLLILHMYVYMMYVLVTNACALDDQHS